MRRLRVATVINAIFFLLIFGYLMYEIINDIYRDSISLKKIEEFVPQAIEEFKQGKKSVSYEYANARVIIERKSEYYPVNVKIVNSIDLGDGYILWSYTKYRHPGWDSTNNFLIILSIFLGITTYLSWSKDAIKQKASPKHGKKGKNEKARK